MSLDEIIAREPLRYTGAEMRPPDSGKNGLKICRPKLFGRLMPGPYQQGDEQRSVRLRDKWAHYTKTPMCLSPFADRNKKCPYFLKYNGVFVTENSPLLNRTVGEVEAIRKCPEDEVDSEEEVEEVEEDEDQDYRPIAPSPKPLLSLAGRQRRFSDMNYVRLPVHQRLGYTSNQFLKSRVNLAAKFLRSKQQQLTKWKSNERHGVRSRRNYLTHRKLKMPRQQHPDQTQMIKNSNGMIVNIENELATKAHNQPVEQMAMIQGGGDGVFVAPLSRQNVEQLSGRFRSSGASSQITSVSKSNEDILHERLSTVENILFQNQAVAPGMSVINGYLPMSRQLAMNNMLSATQSDNSSVSIMGGVPMANIGGTTMSVVNGIPMMNNSMALVSGVPLQQPVTMMLASGELQSFMPLNSGPSTSGQYVITQRPCVPGRIVQCQQDGGITIHSMPTVQTTTSSSTRLGRQLVIAANRQPLDIGIQNNISASQAGFSCNNISSRLPRESFNYQPIPHVTQSSISKRISCLPRQKDPTYYGRRYN